MHLDYQKFTLELVRLGWIVQIHTQNSDKYVLTSTGMEYLRFYKGLDRVDASKSFGGNAIQSEQFQWLVQNGILARHYDMDAESERISPTPYGFGLFSTIEFWLDESLQKKIARKEKSKEFLQTGKKYLNLFMKNLNHETESAEEIRYGDRGHIK